MVEEHNVSTSTTGTISELRVAADLLAKGYHVFRSLSPNCPCDLVAMYNGLVMRLEVRTTRESLDGKPFVNKGRPRPEVDCYVWVLPGSITYDPITSLAKGILKLRGIC